MAASGEFFRPNEKGGAFGASPKGVVPGPSCPKNLPEKPMTQPADPGRALRSPSGPIEPALYRQALTALPHPLYLVDVEDGTVLLAAGGAAAQGSDHPSEVPSGYCLDHQCPPPCLTTEVSTRDRLREAKGPIRAEHLHLNAQGNPVPVEVFATPVQADPDGSAYVVETVRDLSELKALEGEIHQAALVFHGTREGIMITDPQGRIERVNKAFARITGFSQDEATGRRPGDLLGSGWQGPEFYRRMWETIRTEGSWQGALWNRRKGGEIFKEWLTITAVKDHRGRVCRYLGLFTDITEGQGQEEQRILRLAYFDPLTELPNRATLEDRLEKALARSQRGESDFALLFVDLDGFKEVNDRWGHRAGDAILREAAARLSRTVRRTDTVARIGGDEFVTLLEGSENCLGQPVAEKLLAAFQEPFHLENGQTVQLDLSIGLLECPAPDGSDRSPEELIDAADQAMYAAKRNGRNQFRRGSLPGTKPAAPTSERLGRQESGAREILEALDREELLLYYQPEVGLWDQRLGGLEALIRWHHPQQGIVGPSSFWKGTPGPDLAPRIDRWVLRRVSQQLRQWEEDSGALCPVGVNLSWEQWQDCAALRTALEENLTEEGLSPTHLELEIPETFLREDDPAHRYTLESLRALGVGITIDSFGDGSMPLSLLSTGAITKLKLSHDLLTRSLAVRTVSEPVRVLELIYALAHQMGIEVVAKGVETRDQCQWLRNRGTQEAQGFYFAPPQPAAQLEPILAAGRVPVDLSA